MENRRLPGFQGDPRTLAGSIQHVIASVDPDQPVSGVRAMDDVLAMTVADRQQQMMLLGAFAGLALLLVSLGLYGVLAYAVSQRSREIGLRMALGATPASVMRLVVARGVASTCVGLVIGAAGAWGITRTMTSLLFGVATTDPRTLATAIAILCMVALMACVFPAFNATRADPVVVMREE